MLNTNEMIYLSFSLAKPGSGFGAAMVKRSMRGTLVVGAAIEAATLNDAVTQLMAACDSRNINVSVPQEVRGVYEGTPSGIALAREVVRRVVPSAWIMSLKPVDACREMLMAEAAGTQFVIDEAAPGAVELARDIANNAATGRLDAVALCVARAKQDVPDSGRVGLYKRERIFAP